MNQLTFAHIIGIPIEETLGSFGPALFAAAFAVVATLRARFRIGRSGIADPRQRPEEYNRDPVARANGGPRVTRR